MYNLISLDSRIPVKLRAEDHINLSSGSSASAKRGSVDVHRGGSSMHHQTRAETSAE